MAQIDAEPTNEPLPEVKTRGFWKNAWVKTEDAFDKMGHGIVGLFKKKSPPPSPPPQSLNKFDFNRP